MVILLSFLTLLSSQLIGMCKQLASLQHSIHGANREVNAPAVLSLSTVVLNSRDWSEIIWLPRNSHFKINLPIGLYPKKPAGMHWLGRNDGVP